ncbi:MAG TPA: hypothetical protein VIX81_09885 [Gammaproteobacteria bacterium]
MTTPTAEQRLAQRLEARGIRLHEVAEAGLVAECIACRARWEIARGRLGAPHEDEGADWWWCPNGCNRSE